MKVALAENEPMVISAAVNSLGEIGINSNDEVVDAISFANRRNQILNPTSSLAFEVIDAYAKLADNTENKKIIIDSLKNCRRLSLCFTNPFKGLETFKKHQRL